MASRGRACVVVLVPGGHGIGRSLRTHIRSSGTGGACGSRVAARGGSRSGAFLTWAVSGSGHPGSIVGTRGVHFRPGQPVRGLAGVQWDTRHGPAWTAAGTPGAPYGGKQGCAPTAASPRAAVRRIGLVPSKIAKILAVRAISAGQRPADPRGISTDSARPVRDECRFRVGPRPVSIVVRTHAEKVLVRFHGCRRQPTPQQVHLRYILALTCQYLVHHDTRPRARRGRAHTGRAARECPGTPGRPLSRRHGGPHGPDSPNLPIPAYPPPWQPAHGHHMEGVRVLPRTRPGRARACPAGPHRHRARQAAPPRLAR